MAQGQEASGQTAGGAPRCANGCGFFGSVATKNYCSKCYRDHLKAIDVGPVVDKIKADKAALIASTPKIKVESAAAAAAAPAPEAAAAEAPATKPAPSRCGACGKKVGLLGFACRCSGTFCSLHRYGDAHACDFDYKKADREKIAKQNPLVVAPKITKI